MRPAAGMVVGAVLVAAAVSALAAWRGMTGVAGPVFGGMLGPLVAVVGTWFAVVRAHRHNPAGVTRVMLMAFVVKALFFGAYVVVMVAVVGLEPVPFVVSFAAFFVGLYALQAALLARLFRRPQGAV